MGTSRMARSPRPPPPPSLLQALLFPLTATTARTSSNRWMLSMLLLLYSLTTSFHRHQPWLQQLVQEVVSAPAFSSSSRCLSRVQATWKPTHSPMASTRSRITTPTPTPTTITSTVTTDFKKKQEEVVER